MKFCGYTIPPDALAAAHAFMRECGRPFAKYEIAELLVPYLQSCKSAWRGYTPLAAAHAAADELLRVQSRGGAIRTARWVGHVKYWAWEA